MMVSAWANTVDQIDGNDWMATPLLQKSAFIQGFYSANIAALHANWEMLPKDSNGDLTESAAILYEKLYNYYYYGQTIADILYMLDSFYSEKDNRHFFVWSAIPSLCNKFLKIEDSKPSDTDKPNAEKSDTDKPTTKHNSFDNKDKA
jgi:hypothetical protein